MKTGAPMHEQPKRDILKEGKTSLSLTNGLLPLD